MCQCAPDTFSFSAILGAGMCFWPAQKPLLFIWQDLCAEMRILMNFLKKNWRLCFGCYIFIYLPWFFYLEKKITMETPNLHIINNAIDDMIPFCVYFIIPYMLGLSMSSVHVFICCLKHPIRNFCVSHYV